MAIFLHHFAFCGYFRFFISLLAGITSFAILNSVDWYVKRIIPGYIFCFCYLLPKAF